MTAKYIVSMIHVVDVDVKRKDETSRKLKFEGILLGEGNNCKDSKQ